MFEILMKTSVLIWTALLVRVLSQLFWQDVSTYDLDIIYDFGYNMILATEFWFTSEVLKLLTCLLAAYIAIKFYRFVKRRFALRIRVAVLTFVVAIGCVSYVHAYLWIIADCQFALSSDPEGWECVREAQFPLL